MANRLIVLALLACMAPPRTAVAQKVVKLPKHDAELSEPFTLLGSVRELKDGRVMASDARDKTLQLIDLKSGGTSKIGREGQGPGEYSYAGRLLAFPGDTTAMYDLFNTRYLLIGPDGKAGKDFRLEESTIPGDARGGRGGGGIRIGGAQPRASDSRGRIYYEGSSMSASPDGIPVSTDTAPVVRYDRASHRSDTVAWVHLPAATIKASGSANNRSVQVTQNPFGLRDDWAVFPDGRVAVARASDYHVDFFAAGARRSAPPVKFERMPFTEADKREYRDARKNTVGMRVNNDNGKITRSVGPAPTDAPDPEWPQLKAPFPTGGVWARPNGELWIERVRNAGEKVRGFNVFDAQGKLLGVVELPPNTRLVGFGAQALYAVRVDGDDLQHLQRYRLPESTLVP